MVSCARATANLVWLLSKSQDTPSRRVTSESRPPLCGNVDVGYLRWFTDTKYTWQIVSHSVTIRWLVGHSYRLHVFVQYSQIHTHRNIVPLCQLSTALNQVLYSDLQLLFLTGIYFTKILIPRDSISHNDLTISLAILSVIVSNDCAVNV